MSDLVDITLPSGEAATVPREDLAQAIAGGAAPVAAPAAGAYEAEAGGVGGRAAAFGLGLGRMVTGGASDALLIEGANIIGGEGSRAEMLHGLNVVRDTNKYTDLAGEGAGLFLPGAGKGTMAVGAGIERGAASLLGRGLLGHVGAMAARGGIEGAILGAQHQITEDTLGDVPSNGEKIFASASKDALLGAGIGGVLGGLGHVASESLTGLRAARGPRPAGLLDEVAGLEGAGKPLAAEAGAAESLVKDLQRAGATSEQAATLADEIKTAARARTTGGPLSGALDEGAAKYAAFKSGGNEDMREAIERGYVDAAKRLGTHEVALDTHALSLAEKGTALMRAEEVMNRINFLERPDQFARLLPTEAGALTTAADASARMTQQVDAFVSKFEQVRLEGAQAVQMKDMRRLLNSTYKAHMGVVDATTDAGRREAMREMYMSTYKLKQEVQKLSGFGKAEHLTTDTERMFRPLSEQLRVGLEDEAVWGQAGAANREWNATFSQALPRRQDFASRFGVSIDAVSGVPKPEVDFDKARGILTGLRGSGVDDVRQGVKSASSYTDGVRDRLDALEQYADISAADRSVLSQARKHADVFDATFADARKEAEIIGRVRQQALEEQGKSLGGVLGLATDVMTRPLQTMERLGVIKAGVERFEKGIEAGINRFFEGKGSALMRRAEGASSAIRDAARPQAAVVKDIASVREIAANQPALEGRVRQLLGDLPAVAPKHADAAAAVALRALTFLASEAPQGTVSTTVGMQRPQVRYTGAEINSFETKRQAAFHPQSVVDNLQQGRLDRDGIRTVKFVYPQLFLQMQDMARTQLMRLEADGKLDAMPYQRKAAIATLLEVAPDGTWRPDFMALMQSVKVPPPPPPAPEAQGGGRRPIKLDTDVFATEAQQVEGRTT